MAVVAGALVIEMPAPSSTIPTASTTYGVSGATGASRAIPAPMSRNPRAIVRPVPNRAAMSGLRGDMMMSAGGSGRVASPASSGEYPRTNCRYRVRRNNQPNITKKDVVTTALPTLNRRSPKYEIGSIGCSATISQRTKAKSTTAATTNEPTTKGSVQPRSAPSMTPNSSDVSPMSESTAPGGSSGVSVSSFDCGQ